MVQTISSVSMFFETRAVKSSSKVKENSFDSFLKTEPSETTCDEKTDATVVPSDKSAEATGNNAKTVIQDNAQSNGKEVQVSDNGETDNGMPEAENVTSEECVVTDAVLAGKSHITEMLVTESVDMVSVENTADTKTADTLLLDETEELLPEEVLSEILMVLNQIVTVSQKVFQCTEDELLDAVQGMQFEITDFFNPNQIRELFLQVQGAEASELLTNETLCESFMKLQEQIDDILRDSNLTELIPKMNEPQEMFDVSEYKEQIIDFVFERETTPEFYAESVKVDEKTVGQKSGMQEVIQPSELLQNETDERMEYVSFEQSDELGLQKTETSKDETMFDAEQSESNANEASAKPESRFEHANTFISKLVAAVKTTTSEVVSGTSQAIDMYDIAMQVIEQVKLQVRPDTTKMEIQLNPEQLGKVEVEITSKNGELSAKLNVQSEQVKEAVEGQMQMLRETLELQGLKVENIEVTVAEFGFRFQDEAGSNQPQQQRQRRNGLINIDETETEEIAFQDAAEVMKELNGNSIDYVA